MGHSTTARILLYGTQLMIILEGFYVHSGLVDRNLSYCNTSDISVCKGFVDIYEHHSQIRVDCKDFMYFNHPNSTPAIFSFRGGSKCIYIPEVSIKPITHIMSNLIALGISLISVLLIIIGIMLKGVHAARTQFRLSSLNKPKFSIKPRGLLKREGANERLFTWAFLLFLAFSKNPNACSLPNSNDNDLAIFDLNQNTNICLDKGGFKVVNYTYEYPAMFINFSNPWQEETIINKGCAGSNVCESYSNCNNYGLLGKQVSGDLNPFLERRYCVAHEQGLETLECYFRSWTCWAYSLKVKFNYKDEYKVFNLGEPLVDYSIEKKGKVKSYISIMSEKINILDGSILVTQESTKFLWVCATTSMPFLPEHDKLGDLQIINGSYQFPWDSIIADVGSRESTGSVKWPTSFISNRLESSCEQLGPEFMLVQLGKESKLVFSGTLSQGKVLLSLAEEDNLIEGSLLNHCYSTVIEVYGVTSGGRQFTYLIKSESLLNSSHLVITSPCISGSHIIECNGLYNYFVAYDYGEHCNLSGTILDFTTTVLPIYNIVEKSHSVYNLWGPLHLFSWEHGGGTLLVVLFLVSLGLLGVKRILVRRQKVKKEFLASQA